jgi:predicted neuraminidase
MSNDKLSSRLGWFTRTHPLELPSGRILLPMYSDGFSFSLVGISDDGGNTWTASEPIVGYGNIQPSLVRRKNGELVAFMRDNGPAPKRIHTSTSWDDGMTWTMAEDTEFPNPGASVEAIALSDGSWLIVYNDLESGRHSLAVSLSDDEGRTWKWTRHLELDRKPKDAASFHYPSVIQARDGLIHVTYSYFVNHLPADSPRKAIKHARFNTAWVKEGDSK